MKKAKKKTLTPMQSKFADIVILMEISGKVNMSKALQIAGSTSTGQRLYEQASKWASLPQVKAKLSRARARVKRVMERTEAEIIAQFEKLGFSELTDFVSWGRDGLKLKPSKEIPKDKLPALKSITIEEHEYKNKRGKKGTTRRIHVELHSPKGSLDSLAKIKNMMKPDTKEIASFAIALHEAMKDEHTPGKAKE